MKTRHIFLIALLGAYLNTVADGFHYGVGQHEFQLAMVNWLNDPALYPDDPIRGAFERYPSLHWRLVAWAAAWMGLKNVLFGLFLVTKLFLFWGLARLAAYGVKDARLLALIVAGLAISPVLAGPTPFGGGGGVIGGLYTHTTLAGTLLVWAGVAFLEKRWLAAGALLGAAVHIHVSYAAHTFFAFAAFALFDWREQKRCILLAAVLLGIFLLGWVALERRAFGAVYPENYVETLLIHYPYHLQISSRSAYDLTRGVLLLAAVAAVVIGLVRLGAPRLKRLEVLALSFAPAVLLGVLVGEWWQAPQLIRLQFLRADTFLFLYALLAAAVMAARALGQTPLRLPATVLLASLPALLLPLSDGRALAAFLLVAGILVALPGEWFELLCRHIALPKGAALGVAGVVVAAIAFLGFRGWELDPAKLVVLAGVLAAGLCYSFRRAGSEAAAMNLARTTAVLVLVAALLIGLPRVSRFWQPEDPPSPSRAAWYELQHWAREHTAVDEQFLLPPFPGGFRIFSQRSNWVSWRDGDIAWFYPEYGDEWRRRLSALGLPLTPGRVDGEEIQRRYRDLPWDRLEALAQAHRLRYVVQEAGVSYPVEPVFVNREFAVYSAEVPTPD